jgi:hypothetical protein
VKAHPPEHYLLMHLQVQAARDRGLSLRAAARACAEGTDPAGHRVSAQVWIAAHFRVQKWSKAKHAKALATARADVLRLPDTGALARRIVAMNAPPANKAVAWLARQNLPAGTTLAEAEALWREHEAKTRRVRSKRVAKTRRAIQNTSTASKTPAPHSTRGA